MTEEPRTNEGEHLAATGRPDPLELAGQVLMNNYGRPQRELVRGEGCYVWDSSGTRYLDFLAGIAVNSLGHAHPALVAAVSEQVGVLAHVSNFFVTPPELDLAARLLRLSGAGGDGRVLFTNSGAEANEAAFKLARLHGRNTGASTVLALEQGFHGRTMGALALTANPKYTEPFAPLPGPVRHIPADGAALRAALDEGAAALFLEPIQGEAGVVPLPAEFLREAREATTQAGALLVIDEVQTGIGRLGDWFGFQAAGITPDVVTVAKGLGGGIPIGAAIGFGAAAHLFGPGSHGTTFGGNPLSSRAALAVLDTIESEQLLHNVQLRSQQLQAGIMALASSHPLIRGTRGRGLLIAIELGSDKGPALVEASLKRGLIVNSPRPHLVRIAPPLIVGTEEVEEFLGLFEAALSDVAGVVTHRHRR